MELRGFCGPSYVSTSPLADGEVCMNWYPETIEAPRGTTKVALYPTPGLTAFATVPQAPVRGIFGQSGRCFVVGGAVLYELTSAGVATAKGTLALDANPVTMTTNGDGGQELFITSGDTGYIFDLVSGVLTSVVTHVTMGDMLDGYFLALDVDTSTLKISALLDGVTTWDPTQIAQRSTASDPWKSLLVLGKNIWLFGEFTSELWYNTGDNPFPFAPFPGALIQMGIGASFSAVRVGNTAIWLAQNAQGARTIVKAQGITVEKVSTFAIDRRLQDLDRVSDAWAYAYQELGHTFYVINFPTANVTLVYDDTQGVWHERGDWQAEPQGFDADRPCCHASIFDQHLVGDRESGAIYTMSADVSTTADGEGIRRLRRTPGLQQEQQEQYFHCFRLFVEPGLGAVYGDGDDPQIVLRYSNNGGKTWSNELSRSLGPLGNYETTVDWYRLGMSRYPRQWEVTCQEPIPVRLLGAWVNPA